MEDFLAALAGRLVPACDPNVVRAVYQAASAGHAGSHARDGRRASVLTPSGLPFEVSITGGGGRVAAVLRYVTEAATGSPFFAPRLAAQRAVIGELAGWLPAGETAGTELQAFLDVLFPEPAAIPARTRFASFVGVVHTPEEPRHAGWLKLYGNLVRDLQGAVRLSAAWPAYGDLLDVAEGLAGLVPQFAALEISAAGEHRHKLYFRPRDDDPAVLAGMVRRCGADPADVESALAEAGVRVSRWTRVYVGCEALAGREPVVAAYIPARTLGCDRRGMAGVVRHLAERHLGSAAPVDALADVAASSAHPAWCHIGVGLGLRPGGGVAKLNVYFAADRPAVVPASAPR